jgi:hypothetical protein
LILAIPGVSSELSETNGAFLFMVGYAIIKQQRQESFLAMAKSLKLDAERIAEAIDYKLRGHAYESIAEQMGIKVAGAVALVSAALFALVRDPAESQILLDLQRVDQMLAAVYPTATQGDQEAIRTVIALRQEREALEKKLQRTESFRRVADG